MHDEEEEDRLQSVRKGRCDEAGSPPSSGISEWVEAVSCAKRAGVIKRAERSERRPPVCGLLLGCPGELSCMVRDAGHIWRQAGRR